MNQYEDIGTIGEFQGSRSDHKILVRLVRAKDGAFFIDMRAFANRGKIPTQKGIRIPTGQIQEFTRLMTNVLAATEEIGGKK